MSQSAAKLQEVKDRAAATARQLEESGKWSAARDQQVAELFERAAQRALRAPSPLERSVIGRNVAKRVVPRALRPHLRRVLGATERRVRSLMDRVQ